MTNSVLCSWIPPYRNKVTLLGSRLVASLTCNPAPPPPSLVSFHVVKNWNACWISSLKVKKSFAVVILIIFDFFPAFRFSLLISRIKSTHFTQCFLLMLPENFRKPCNKDFKVTFSNFFRFILLDLKLK